jgi:hypothetical protein
MNKRTTTTTEYSAKFEKGTVEAVAHRNDGEDTAWFRLTTTAISTQQMGIGRAWTRADLAELCAMLSDVLKDWPESTI